MVFSCKIGTTTGIEMEDMVIESLVALDRTAGIDLQLPLRLFTPLGSIHLSRPLNLLLDIFPPPLLLKLPHQR